MRSSNPATADEKARSRELRLKLLWLTVFRTVAITLLLGVNAVRALSKPALEEPTPQDSLVYALIAVVYLLTLGYGFVLRRGKAGRQIAYVQIVGDVVLATCLVYLTNGPESPFTFAYLLAIVAASILLYQRGALLAAASASVSFVLLTLALHHGLVLPPDGMPVLTGGRVAFLLLSNVLAQFLIAALASYLSRQLWTAGGRLSAREADLRALAALQRQILEHMPSGLITCEGDGQLTFVNRAGAAILGLEGSPPQATNIEMLIPGALNLGPASRRSELAVETANGRRILGLTVTRLDDQGSRLVVFQDLTELRRAEDELRRMDHLAALGKLSAQLAHEIRNPLAAMRGSAQMLASECPPGGQASQLTGILLREADRLAALVQDFLRFARPPPPARRACAVADLVRETVDMLRADPLASGIQIELALAPVTASVDPDQLRQVLLNLLRNAFLAVGSGGRVEVRLQPEAQALRLSVWDSAGSIPPTNLLKIFDPFFTTRPGGTGLGLSTTHSIVVAHGGTIHVSSSPARGTEFVIALPYAPTEDAVASPGG